MRNYNSQLRSLITGGAISEAGGAVYVTSVNGTAKLALTDANGGALANPLPLTNGFFDFNVADSVPAVDLYIQAPSGHFVVVRNVKASGQASINIDDSVAQTTMVIPFNAADQTAATETNTGFTQIGAIAPNVGVEVVTVDATETIDVGTLSSDSGDADGFIDGLSVATAGYIKATSANAGTTRGADLVVQDSANAGDDFPEINTDKTGKAITYTLSAGSDTAAGFILLPAMLPASKI